MKASLLLLTLFPLICHAQLEVGIDGGFAKFKVAGENKNIDRYRTGAVADVSVRYLLKPLSFGVGYTYVSGLAYTAKGATDVSYAAQPLHRFYAFGNYNFKRGVYYGISAGYAGYMVKYPPATSFSREAAYNAGVHVGVIRQVYGGFGIDLQVGATALFGSSATLIYFPFTAGLHYRWGQKK